MILFRYLLIGLIVYLLVRSFTRYGKEEPSAKRPEAEKKNDNPGKKVSKEIGEYIDYEEIDK